MNYTFLVIVGGMVVLAAPFLLIAADREAHARARRKRKLAEQARTSGESQ
jgi:hypothetical protein